MNKQEVLVGIEYNSEGLMKCNECGGYYKQLSMHLKRTHQIEPDDYRDKYKIPYGRGLVSVGLSELISTRAKKNLDIIMANGFKKLQEKRRGMTKLNKRVSSYVREQNRINAKKAKKVLKVKQEKLYLDRASDLISGDYKNVYSFCVENKLGTGVMYVGFDCHKEYVSNNMCLADFKRLKLILRK